MDSTFTGPMRNVDRKRFWRGPAIFHLLMGLVLASNASLHAQRSEQDRSAAMADRVAELIGGQLKEQGWEPAGECSDAAFMRRAYLDLTGTPPTASEVLEFLRNESPSKRPALVKRLSASWDRWATDNHVTPLPLACNQF